MEHIAFRSSFYIQGSFKMFMENGKKRLLWGNVFWNPYIVISQYVFPHMCLKTPLMNEFQEKLCTKINLHFLPVSVNFGKYLHISQGSGGTAGIILNLETMLDPKLLLWPGTSNPLSAQVSMQGFAATDSMAFVHYRLHTALFSFLPAPGEKKNSKC